MTDPRAMMALAAVATPPSGIDWFSPFAIMSYATLATAVGLWWLLPGSGAMRRVPGELLAAVGFGIFASRIPVAGDWLAQGLLEVIAGATVVAAVATISCRSPVYCAIWFGMTLAGTAGLFLLAGAAFLAVATLVVYAGAILVTFLFVLMLSQPEGHTTYDRRSWEAPVSAVTGAVLVGIFTATISAAATDAGKLASSSATRAVRDGSRVASQSPNTGLNRLPRTARSRGSRQATSNAATARRGVAEQERERAAHAATYDVAQLGETCSRVTLWRSRRPGCCFSRRWSGRRSLWPKAARP